MGNNLKWPPIDNFQKNYHTWLIDHLFGNKTKPKTLDFKDENANNYIFCFWCNNNIYQVQKEFYNGKCIISPEYAYNYFQKAKNHITSVLFSYKSLMEE